MELENKITKLLIVINNYFISRYIKILSILDIFFALSIMPEMFDTEYCIYDDYADAVYFSFVGDVFLYYFRHLSTFVLLSLSFDRFLAIWYSGIFQKIKSYTTTRLVIIWVWITVSMIPHILLGNVSHYANDHWLTIRGSENTKSPWAKVYKIYIMIAFGVLPSILLISLTIGMLLGIKKKIINSPVIRNMSPERQSLSGRNRQLSLTVAVLVYNVLYVATISPYLVNWVNVVETGCRSNVAEENRKSIAFCILMSWVIFNLLVFFLINKDYRNELKLIINW